MITDATATYAGNGRVSLHFDAQGVMVTLDVPTGLLRSLVWQGLRALREADGTPGESGVHVILGEDEAEGSEHRCEGRPG